MASDLPVDAVLPDDIPNARKQNLGFFARLFGAWVAMGRLLPVKYKLEYLILFLAERLGSPLNQRSFSQ
ncbi:hypothetical protein [Yoonia sp.]|uniref:hypothetical protein n=1 Tax=Yoonia sp. TaxID=2212373 RepID=UPI00391AA5F7